MRAAVAAACLGLCASLAALPAPAAASGQAGRWNARAPENSQVLPAFTAANVEAVVAAIGARSERRGGAADRPVLSVTFANGRRAAIVLGSCDRQGACRALSIQTVWERPARAAPDRLMAGIQQFNQRHAFARAFLAGDGRPMLSRYLTADYGYIRGDLAVNLIVYADQAARFADDVLRPLQ